jgi:hypothetical protein
MFAPTADDNSPVPIYGRTRLMKMLFIFEKELSKSFQSDNQLLSFDFEAYNFGPFSRRVFEAMDFLETRGIIESFEISSNVMSRNDMGIDGLLSEYENETTSLHYNSPYQSEGFKLTRRGIGMIKDKNVWFSWPNLDDSRKKMLIALKTSMVNASLKEILRYVYTKYSNMAEQSIILKQVFPDGAF